jgi:membrane-associated phospholipid phosphatase
MKKLSIYAGLWSYMALVCATISAISFDKIDVPLAKFAIYTSGYLDGLQRHLGSSVLLAIESVLFFGIAFIGLLRGGMSPLGKAVAVACATSICAYAMNASILKVAFGVPTPGEVLKGARHTIHWFSGSDLSSFPSGHMVLASAFVGVFSRFYRASIWPLSGILLLGAIFLVAGDWHFLSDVITGTFIGTSVGQAIGKRWADDALHGERQKI